MRLFLERGFDGATLDAIAEAADVSRRSLFHYFESKEAIVQALESGNLDMLHTAIASSPPDLPPLDSVHHAFLRIIARYQTKEAMEINRLMRTNEALRARKQANYEHQERIIFAALCEKWPKAERHVRLRLVAMIGVGAMRLASERWYEEGMKRPLVDYLKDAIQSIRKELS